jgi:hypothetical protein
MTYGYGDDRDDRRVPPRPDNQSYPPPAGGYGQGYPPQYDEPAADPGYDPFATQNAPRGRPAYEPSPGYEQPTYGQPYGAQPEYGQQPAHGQSYQQADYGQQPDYGQPGYNQPGYNQPAYGGQPDYGQSYQQPAYGQPPTYSPPPRNQEYPAPGHDQGGYHQGGYDQGSYDQGGYQPTYGQPGYGQQGYEQPGYAQPTSGYPRSDRGYVDQGYDPAYAPRSAPPRTEQSYGPRPGSTGVYGRPHATAPHTTEAGGYGVPGPRDPQASGQYARQSSYEPATSQRYRDPEPEPEEPAKRRTGKVLGISLLVLALVGAAIGGGLWWAHRNTAGTAGPTPSRSTIAAIADRVKDPKPLTVAEVYGPTAVIASSSPAGKYKVLGSQLSADCGVAVTDALVALLKTAGCTQVVRGTLTSPDGTHIITAGIFNLKDSSAASQVYSGIMGNVTAGKGRFTGFATGGAGDVITQAQANLAWDSVGHYVVYCVVALADGKPIAKDEKATMGIINDVIEVYLGDKVISNRATAAAAASPSAPK